MSQALYRKWRPRLWEQVVGQEHIVTTLQNAIRSDRVGHAYLFAGPRGTGKTTTARLLAKAVNCLDPDPGNRPCDHCDYCQAVNDNRFMDLIEIDAASNTSVDDVRDLREKINFSPSQGKFKVYIIDEVHMLSTAAFNALLKTLEEPPPHAIFILATTEIHKIPATVLSRCQRHEFRKIPVQTIVSQLTLLADQEGLEVDPAALVLIARQATGAMRDAISLLDQLTSTGQAVNLEDAQQVLGTATNQMVVDLAQAIILRDPAAGLGHIHAALDKGSDPRQFSRQIVDYLRNLLLVRMGNADLIDATPEQRVQIAQHAQAFEMPHLMETLRLFNGAASEVRSGWQPGLPLELAFAQAVEYHEPQVVVTPVSESTAPSRPAIIQSTPAVREDPPRPQAERNESKPATQESRAPEKKKVEDSATRKDKEPEPARQQPAQAGGDVSLKTILDGWDQIRSKVRSRNKTTESLLNSCKSVQIKDGILQLGFASEVLRGKMDKEENIKIARAVILQTVGIDVPIKCVVAGGKGGSNSPSDLGVDADGMVNAAISLGGKIVQKD